MKMDGPEKRKTTSLALHIRNSIYSWKYKHCLLCNKLVENEKEVDFDICRGTSYKTVKHMDYNTFKTPRAFKEFLQSGYVVCGPCMAKSGWRERVQNEIGLQATEFGGEHLRNLNDRINDLDDRYLKELEKLERERDKLFSVLPK